MPGFSDVTEAEILNHYFRTATATKPTNEFIALFTADPTDAGTGAEVTGTAYARVQVAVADAQWSAPADDGSGSQQVTNVNAVTFPTPGSNWTGPITYFGVMSALTGGVLRMSGALGTSRTVVNGDVAPSFAAGTLVIKLN
jgi:hypothetical protein